jgi:hypothetical protein
MAPNEPERNDMDIQQTRDRLKGIFALIGHDPRGYDLVCWLADKDQLMFLAGCRSFTLEEAQAHWGSPDYPDRVRGQRYIEAIMDLAGLALGGE